MSTNVGQYRPEIDGLRAVAVFLVVVNHANPDGPVGGGFLGVDIFFVVSGFLITSIIANDFESGEFRYRDFLERRARRILPALFFMLVPVTVFAWMFLEMPEKSAFLNSLVPVATFWSNIRFYLDVGYFDVAAAYKPLLHTWSLGVEEQFYIVYPVALLYLLKRGRELTSLSLLTAAVASFLGIQLVSSSAAFYLLPFRMWELLAGALTFFFISNPRNGGLIDNVSDQISSAVSAVALGSILGVALLANNEIPWPSNLTVVPVLATCMLLTFLKSGSFTHWLLSSGPLVRLGLCSYSVYLWHYPIFAFARYFPGEYPTILLLALALALGWLSWGLIETPFRSRTRVSSRAIAGFSIGGIVLCSAVGLIAPRESRDLANPNESPVVADWSPIILLGDSHAERLYRGISVSPLISGAVSLQSSSGCVPLVGVDRFDFRFKKGDCAKFVSKALSAIAKSSKVRAVVLSSMGPIYLTGTAFRGWDMDRVREDGLVLVDQPEISDRWKVFEIGLRNTFQYLRAANKKVIFVIDVPELGIEPRRCLVSKPESCQNSRDTIEQRTTRYRTLVKSVADEFEGVDVFDPTELFCDSTVCRGVIAGKKMYDDGDHVSIDGARMVTDALTPLLNQILKN